MTNEEFFNDKNNMEFFRNYIEKYIRTFLGVSFVDETLLENAVGKSVIDIIERKVIENYNPDGPASLMTVVFAQFKFPIMSAIRDHLRYRARNPTHIEDPELIGSGISQEDKIINSMQIGDIYKAIKNGKSRAGAREMRAKIFKMRLDGYHNDEIGGETGLCDTSVDKHIAKIKKIAAYTLCLDPEILKNKPHPTRKV